ncbi:MAG: hypothetical protein KIT16_05965 [Rhodospirillaceae bacterium]|nr:hypothetical protein [Rhodospirillaceae bacterium]
MKIALATLAAIIGLAVASPSFATTGTQDKTPVVKHKVVKHKVVKHKVVLKRKAVRHRLARKHKLVRKIKLARLHCKADQKIALIDGKRKCVDK